MIILLGGEKGGTGKTTMALNLAAIRAAQGRDVLLVDADRQGSASQWASARVSEGITPPITCIALYGKTLSDQIRALTPKYDDIVIDAGGADSQELRAAMLVANIIITPARPSQFDIYTLTSMDALVGQAIGFNPDLCAGILVNCAPTHAQSTDAADMRAYLADLPNYVLLASTIKDRKAYRACARDGRAVTEYAQPDVKAVAEMLALAQEVWE